MTEGEAWTAEQLAELRARRYTPRSWIRLLACSFARAHETRTERRREHRQTVAIGVVGVAAWIVVLAAGRPWLALAGVLWWLAVTLMVDWHLGMLEDPSGRRLDGLGLANLLSIARAAVVPALVVASPALLLALLVPAGIADGIDGPVARARREESRLGRALDGGVDGFVIGAAAIGAARADILPWWAAALALARHVIQWLVVAAASFIRAEAPARDGLVSGKIPGLILFAGLALAAVRVPNAPVLVLLGALGGLATFGLTVARSWKWTSFDAEDERLQEAQPRCGGPLGCRSCRPPREATDLSLARGGVEVGERATGVVTARADAGTNAAMRSRTLRRGDDDRAR